MTQQARNFVMEAEGQGLEVRHLIHDCDTKYTERFDRVLNSEGARIHRKGPAQPNMNAYAERFVQSIQQECLDHFVVLGEKHLNHIVSEYMVHYHEERAHQALGNAPPTAELRLAQDGRWCAGSGSLNEDRIEMTMPSLNCRRLLVLRDWRPSATISAMHPFIGTNPLSA